MGTARRLVGVLAHPLNRAVFDEESGRVVSGYTIVQPRIEISPSSSRQTLFARIFAGDVGFDIYTHAVSESYQDLFGAGIYVGKGIYDVDAFTRSVEGRVPENALVSHDLFEGIHGRTALATDIVLFEDYPSQLRGVRAAHAPVGARRLAAASVALLQRAVAGRTARGSTTGWHRSTAGRSSTTCGAA